MKTAIFNNYKLSVMKSASSLVALRIGACVHIAGVDRDDQLIVLHVLVSVIRPQD